MKRLICLACTLWLISTNVAAQPGHQEQGQSTAALIERLAKEFPQLSPDDIKLVVDYVKKLERDGMQTDEAIMFGFGVMPRGKALLSKDEQREMTALTSRMKNTATMKERERMQALGTEIKQGKSISEADHKFIASVLKESFLRLPAASQSRLRELYGKAIRAFLQTVQ